LLAKITKIPRGHNVVVIGLGRFGTAVAESLVRLGHDVLGIDNDGAIVQGLADTLTHVVQADTTHADTLKRLGVGDYRHAVVGIGTNIEASLLTTLALSELGITDIWAKAINPNHGRILLRTGAHHVVAPEAEMGERVAHLVTGQLIDFIAFDDDFAIAKVRTPAIASGISLEQAALRKKYGVTIIGMKPTGSDFTYTNAQTVLSAGEMIIVSGKSADVERFAALA
jgi:trk system potassium uptake protein